MSNGKAARVGSGPRLERSSRYHRRFAQLAAAEAGRVLPLFEKACPKDERPRAAVEAIRAWAQGKRTLGMAEVRRLSLGAHAAARAAPSDAARFAARAAGHAVATWHVPTHAMAVPMYACKAILAGRCRPDRPASPVCARDRKRGRGATRRLGAKGLGVGVAAMLAQAACGADPLPKIAQTFEVAGHTAYLYAAPTPAGGKPWVWYAPTLNGVSLAQRKAYFETFLRAGVSLAGFDLGEVRGAPSSTAEFTRFYDEMVRRGWSPRPILLGQSRGGLMLLGWAMRHADKPRAFVGIYPVCNLATWGMKNREVTLADYALPEAELRARMAEFNPLDNLQALLTNRVPVFVVHGDADALVPYDENTRILKERYEAGGGAIAVKLVRGEGHKVSPSFFECRELIEFVLKQAGVAPPPP